jgi:hypothetical protein
MALSVSLVGYCMRLTAPVFGGKVLSPKQQTNWRNFSRGALVRFVFKQRGIIHEAPSIIKRFLRFPHPAL